MQYTWKLFDLFIGKLSFAEQQRDIYGWKMEGKLLKSDDNICLLFYWFFILCSVTFAWQALVCR
jgi:hypothetical protein